MGRQRSDESRPLTSAAQGRSRSCRRKRRSGVGYWDSPPALVIVGVAAQKSINATTPTRRVENRDVKIWPLSCHVMGWHQFRRKPGDKDMLVCQRCGRQEMAWTKRMRDKANNPWS